MTEEQQIEKAVDAINSPVPEEDPRPFWLRLLCSIRAKVTGAPSKPKIEITGGTDF